MTSQDDTSSPAVAAEQRPTPLRSGAEPTSAREPAAQWAVSLLAEAEPYQEVPGRRERVLLGLRSRRLRRPRPWKLAFAALALSASAAFASAAIAGWPVWLAHLIGRASSVPPVETSPAARPAIAKPTDDRATAPAVVPPAAEPPPSTAPTAVPPPVDNPVPQAVHGRRQGNANAPEDTGPLLEAMRALRIEHNPVRARQLLTDYLGQHPRGFLAEEALVMLVEAAAAHHDSDAAALVARYHRLYPDGAFRGQVERISSAYQKKP